MKMKKASELVGDIEACVTLEEAVAKYSEEVVQIGLSLKWLENVFKNKKPLPIVLDRSMRKAGKIVHDIQVCDSLEEAFDKYSEEVVKVGLSTKWLTRVFQNKKSLPVLDLSYDVHGEGVDVLNSMGISAETQTLMWQNWVLLENDIKASWVSGFKKLDNSEPRDVIEYTKLLVDLLTK